MYGSLAKSDGVINGGDDSPAKQEECTLYSRLAHLVLQEGTNQIRANCLKNIIDNMTLTQILAVKKNEFHALQKKKVINDIHLDILYPANALEPRINDIDMTLWLVLIRNITKGKNRIDWKKSPESHDQKWQHQALRLKEVRNRLFHQSLPELSRHEFRELWDIASGALSKLGTSHQVLTEYYNKDLDPLQSKICTLQMREQVLEEMYAIMVNESERRRQLKIIIPLVVGVALLVSAAFVVPLVLFLRGTSPCSKHIQSLNTDKGVIQFLPRAGWGAETPAHPLLDLKTPVENVVIFHTALIGECIDVATCCNDVKQVQNYHMHQREPPFDDIGYNFLIGGDGVVYEGRGWNKVSAAIQGWNRRMISVAFIGNFLYVKPTGISIQAARAFITYMVDNNKLPGNYSLYAHCQINNKYPDSPGEMLYQEMSTWDNFRPVNTSNCRGSSWV